MVFRSDLIDCLNSLKVSRDLLLSSFRRLENLETFEKNFFVGECDALLEEYFYRYDSVLHLIELIKDVDYLSYEILMLKHVYFFSFDDISSITHYSTRHIYRLYTSSVDKLLSILQNKECFL